MPSPYSPGSAVGAFGWTEPRRVTDHGLRRRVCGMTRHALRRYLALALMTVAAVGAGVAAASGSGPVRTGTRARPVRLAPARLPGPGTSEQAVAVAYLDPGIVLSLDVVTGRLLWSGEALGFSSSGVPWS